MTADADARRAAAGEAAASMVRDGMALGLGTGSTAAAFLEALGRRVAAGLRVRGVPTSERTAEQARRLGVPLTDLESDPVLDLAVDGADVIRRQDLALIKGLGGALLREKLVAAAARRFVVVADAAKLTDRLGGGPPPVPVEAVPFGLAATRRRLEALGARPDLRRDADGAAYVTDNGNRILDCAFPVIDDPADLAARIKALPGVVESGLFVGMATEAIVAGPDGVRRLRRGLRPSTPPGVAVPWTP